MLVDQISCYVRWLQRFLVGPGADPRSGTVRRHHVAEQLLQRVMRGLASTAVSPLDALEPSPAEAQSINRIERHV